MSGNLLEGLQGPESQSIEAVKALIGYYARGEEPTEMPGFYRLSGEMVLVLSNKKNSYYVTTSKACSCPSFTYRGGPCKHQRKYFNVGKKSQAEIEAESAAELLRLNTGAKHFRPCLEEA